MRLRSTSVNLMSQNSLRNYLRQLLAVILSALLVPAVQMRVYAQAPAYVGLNAEQLDQLVAPIALYPDSLVASILTASTYPDQISAADGWLDQNMSLPPDQRAAQANAQPWDPSVKALVAFPAVLDNLARNAAWAAQLGNAYFNQPGDVENAVQAMRLQAQQSGRLVSTPQQSVVYANGVVTIMPVNPAVVYVPYYNPWAVWGGFISPWGGWVGIVPPPGIVLGLGLAFGVGIGIGVFAHYGWGFGAWRPAWGGGGVYYGGRAYVSRSVTVINHGNFGGYDRGVFEHGGRGVPAGFHPAARMGAARAAADRAGVRGGSPRAGGFHAAPVTRSPYANRGAPERGGAAAREGRPGGAYSGAARPAARNNPAARAGGERPAARPGGAGGQRPAARAGGERPAARPSGGARPAARPAQSHGQEHGGGEHKK
jgi:Protein of unknown function (DUF3300)